MRQGSTNEEILGKKLFNKKYFQCRQWPLAKKKKKSNSGSALATKEIKSNSGSENCGKVKINVYEIKIGMNISMASQQSLQQ